MSNLEETTATHFIHAIIEEDIANNKNDGRVGTRFPPEPNGYLHIGHAKSICLNFGTAEKYNGTCNLRFDDTNPETEGVEYVEAIQRDIKWLGFDWGDRLFFASDYFDQLFDYAVQLIKSGNAYVDSLTAEEIREHRGTVTSAGRNSPYRDRSVDENLDLFNRMKNGEFDDGTHVLRAKIDMASPNMNLRDPAIYRIRKAHHHRSGDKWCIYPLYDFTHGFSDSIEGITHSLCTLEFENHRPLYDWFLKEVDVFHPQQIEFARLELSHTITSKRKTKRLVEENHVRGWDDPRLSTLSGLRRRGVPPEAIRTLCERVGVAKFNSIIELALLEYCIRDYLNKKANRYMGVLRPLKVVIENYPEGEVEELEAVNNPEDPEAGTRKVPFSRELYIEQEDFMEDPPKKFFRLGVGREVRLRYAYFVTCVGVVKDEATGEIKELRCTYDPETRGGNAPDGRRVKGTIHWVSAEKGVPSEIRLYDTLFAKSDPSKVEEGEDFTANLNPNSLTVLESSLVEPAAKDVEPGVPFQFERQGYFCMDPDTTPDRLVFNRTVTLRDSWAKIQKKEGPQKKKK